MTSLALQCGTGVPPVNQAPPAPWIPLPEAAVRIGVTERGLRDRCINEFKPRGLAEKFDGQWALLPAAHPLLADHRAWRQRDLDQLAELRRDATPDVFIRIAEARRELVLGFDDYVAPAGCNQTQAAALYLAAAKHDGRVGPSAVIRKVAPRRFLDWRLQYRASGAAGGIAALVPEWHGSNAAAPIGESAWSEFLAIQATTQSLASSWRHIDALARRNGDDPNWAWPKYSKIRAHYNRTVHPLARTLARSGPYRAAAACLPKIARSIEETAAGEHLCGDERTFDFMARVPTARGWARARLKLTGWLDVRSRYLAGWCISASANSETILASFKMACVALETVPTQVTLDNGRDYRAVAGRTRRRRKWDEFDSKWISSAFERLSITPHYALKKHPWSKMIERHFGLLAEFDRWFAGYWGGRTDDRPWDAERWTREHVEQLPTEEEVIDAFTEWLAAHHEQRQGGDGMFGLAPRQALRQHFTQSPIRADGATLDALCCRMVGPVKVGRDGVRHQSIRYGKFDQAVFRLMGREVHYLVDPVQRDRITLCDGKGVPIAVAFADRNLGLTADEVRSAERFRRKAMRDAAAYPAARDYLMKTTPQQVAQLRAERARAEQIPDEQLPTPPAPQSIRLARPDVAAAVERQRIAAGAETLRRLSGADAGARAANAAAQRVDLFSLPDESADEPAEPTRRRPLSFAEADALTGADE